MIQFASVFTDHMVLQRNKKIAVFGSGTPDESVMVSIPERSVTVCGITDASGRWQVFLPPMNAAKNYTMTLHDQNGIVCTLTDIAIGEVWLAGGQSNMEFMLKDAAGGQKELQCCHTSNVRYYNVPRNGFSDEAAAAAETAACWQCAGAETAGSWSAVAYWAAKELAERLGITIGIIGCNYGGTSASAWTPVSDLEQHADTRPYPDAYAAATAGKTDAEMIAEYDEYTDYHTKWSAKMETCYRENPNIKWDEVIKRCGENRYPGPMGIKNPLRPGGLYETMLQRVTPYTIRGFFFYQGESDDHLPNSYETLLTMMIRRWRVDWQDLTLPFLMVQLPMFCYDGAEDNKRWCKIREAQMHVYQTLKNTGLAIALDCGEYGNIHPVHKVSVAHRLALQALYHVYGIISETEANGPIYDSCIIQNHALTLSFRYAESGFIMRNGETKFELAGIDGVYYPAQVQVQGSNIVLTAPEVPNPASARYAWTNYATVTMFGKNGIPLAPFRTAEFSQIANK